MLQEMLEGLQELVDLADSDDEDSTAIAFFQDLSGNINNNSSSDYKLMDVGHALADISVDDDSDFYIGILQAAIFRTSGLRNILRLLAYTSMNLCVTFGTRVMPEGHQVRCVVTFMVLALILELNKVSSG